jgi:hypothetical protein
MKEDKLGLLLRATGWRGALARVVLLTLVYLLTVYLPSFLDFASTHFPMMKMSDQQRAGHHGVVIFFRVLWVFVIVVEITRAIVHVAKINK